jgi:glycosyltransferase involved in cell wall biosynthesis
VFTTAVVGGRSANSEFSVRRPLRLAYFVSHPIQYQAPLLRRIAQERDIYLKVFFQSDLSVRGYKDSGFGVEVKWDVPLLEGYEHEFLPVLLDSETLGSWKPLNHGIARSLRNQSFDAVWVHGYSTSTTLQAIRAAHEMRIPVLLRAESNLTDRPRSRKTLLAKKAFFRWLRKRVSAALSIGESNTAYWKHYLGEQVPVFPFYYSVDNKFFQRECAKAAATREEFRRSLGLDPGRPVILYASKLQTRKRCIDLVEAYLQLMNSRSWRSLPYLLIVGDGEERVALEDRSKQAAPGNIRFLGFRNQTELPRLYDLCNVFVLVSVHEPWGLVINEVMNAGRPVIVSDQVGCHKNLVHNGVNGYVVKACDIGVIADSLHAVLGRDENWRLMGEKSLEIIGSYSFDENVRGLRQALQCVSPGFTA